MYRYLFFLIMSLGFTACSAKKEQVTTSSPLQPEPSVVEETAAESAPPSPAEVEERPSLREPLPELIEDPNWQTRYSPDVPYYNRSTQPILATKTAQPGSEVVGQLTPGQAGFIKTCVLDSTFCAITLGGEGLTGYVNMELLGGEAH